MSVITTQFGGCIRISAPNSQLSQHSVADGRKICSGELGISLVLQPIPRAGRPWAGAQRPHFHPLGHGAQGQRCHGKVNPRNLGSTPAPLPPGAPPAHRVIGGHAQRTHNSHATDEAGEDWSCRLGRLWLRVERGCGQNAVSRRHRRRGVEMRYWRGWWRRGWRRCVLAIATGLLALRLKRCVLAVVKFIFGRRQLSPAKLWVIVAAGQWRRGRRRRRRRRRRQRRRRLRLRRGRRRRRGRRWRGRRRRGRQRRRRRGQ